MRRRLGFLAVVPVLAALVLAAPAHGQLRATDAPLPGSDFQGADGDQDDAGALIDWQALEAARRVQHNPDANDDDTAFEGGSKELEPGGWDLGTEAGGVSPDAANIRDAWSAVDQPGADTFLYLAFTRQASEGTSFLTFELNHDDRLWDNGQARIPCRRTGDVLLAYQVVGNVLRVVVRQWTTTATDIDTGCATEGVLETFSELEADVDVQGAMNDAPITSRLPGALTGTIGPGRFGEAAINVASLLRKAFGERCMAFSSVWMHSRSAVSGESNMQDYVAPRALAVQTCTASGVKFFDADADGQPREPGERGIPRFLIWADYDDDGVHDDIEPFSVSDADGRYVIHDIQPPRGTYRLRETLLRRASRALPIATDWICSFPSTTAPDGRFPCAWGPIDVSTTPNATGLDFGNWFPARLTVRKRLFPATDPGAFDLLVNGRVAFAAAGDRDHTTLFPLAPGTYVFSERAVAGTDPSAYKSTVACRRDVNRFERARPGTEFALMLSAGQAGSCTAFNARGPAIAISKRGPAFAEAGETLEYELLVTNPGAFPVSGVTVTDPDCPPGPPSKEGDETPRTLDPGDEWIYRCSRATRSGGDACEERRVSNTAAVSGTAGGTTVTDEDEISTGLTCPDSPRRCRRIRPGRSRSIRPARRRPTPATPGWPASRSSARRAAASDGSCRAWT